MKNKIKEILNILDNKVLNFTVKSKFISHLYYIVKPSFLREEKAVLLGRYHYNQNSNNAFYLRRSIHRIEKGILMKPRREVFAEDYIEKTVDTFIKLKNISESTETINWANDVLSEYFSITNYKKSIVINSSRKKFFEEKINNRDKNKKIPYLRKPENRPNISIEEFKNLAVYRRSVRWFTDEKVSHDSIDKAISIASYSPSACNRLPYKFRVFDKREMVKDIAKSAMGTTGYIDNIPTIVAVIGDLSAYPSERDRHLIYIDSSLAAMSFVYGLELQSIGSCIINWPDIEKREKTIDKLLNLQTYERVIMLIAIGYEDSDGMVAYSQKKSIDEIRSYNI